MLNRRTFIAAAGAAAFTRPAFGQNTGSRVLRLVPQADLANLDPVFSPSATATTHAYAIYDMLYGFDASMKPQPQMARGHEVSDDRLTWTIALREGLRFHDGEPVLARDCIASLKRWAQRDAVGTLLLSKIDAWEAVDDSTFRIKLKQPFPLLLDALAKVQVPALIMPERLAITDPSQQVTEMVGSGPFRFVKEEWSVGNLVVYERNADYVPRSEEPSLFSGGKHAHFDRVEFQIIPDPSTASAALGSGEVDWVEQTLPDLNALFEGNSDVHIENVDAGGLISLMRFNTLTAPFNNPELRRIVLSAINQSDYMQAVTGDAIEWRRCASLFPCGLPKVNEVAAGVLNQERDWDKIKAAVKAAGYANERVVLMNPTDFPSIAPLGHVTQDILTRAGFNVDMQAMDWGTLVQRRISKAPVESGGWSIFHSWTTSSSIADPLLNIFVRGQGAKGYTGWFESQPIEDLVTQYVAAETDADRMRLFDLVQEEAFKGPPSIPLGQYFPTTALRSDLTGRIPFPLPLLWNIRRA